MSSSNILLAFFEEINLNVGVEGESNHSSFSKNGKYLLM